MTALPGRLPCPLCGHAESDVVDSRGVAEQHLIRRRRKCKGCEVRFSTVEITEATYEELGLKAAKLDDMMSTIREAL